MKSLIRSLNERGQSRFRAWLDAGASGDAPFELLQDPMTSEPVLDTGEIEQRHFANRYELAVPIVAALAECDFQRLDFDHGVWAWLSLFYFDVLSPKDLTGSRKVMAPHRYIFDPTFRTPYGHLIRDSVVSVKNHGHFAKVLLISPRGGIRDTRVLSDLSYRRDLISNKAVIELAWLLYFNQRKGALRVGTASELRPGSVQRFALVLQQLSLNYDLPAMNSFQIAQLLPPEFNRWKQRAKLDVVAKLTAKA
jgi:hypothetical protein